MSEDSANVDLFLPGLPNLQNFFDSCTPSERSFEARIGTISQALAGHPISFGTIFLAEIRVIVFAIQKTQYFLSSLIFIRGGNSGGVNVLGICAFCDSGLSEDSANVDCFLTDLPNLQYFLDSCTPSERSFEARIGAISQALAGHPISFGTIFLAEIRVIVFAIQKTQYFLSSLIFIRGGNSGEVNVLGICAFFGSGLSEDNANVDRFLTNLPSPKLYID